MKPNTVIKWHRAIKADAQCVTCQRFEHSVKPDEIEFHHLVPGTKADCVSNIAYRHQIIYKQPPAPILYLLEMMKCVPMCRIDHTQLHEAERAGDTGRLAERFDLIEDAGYQKLNGQFWQMTIAKTPPEAQNEIRENLLDMLEDGRIVMGPRGWQLATAPPVGV